MWPFRPARPAGEPLDPGYVDAVSKGTMPVPQMGRVSSERASYISRGAEQTVVPEIAQAMLRAAEQVIAQQANTAPAPNKGPGATDNPPVERTDGPRHGAWMGAGTPPQSMNIPEARGRAFDFPVGANLQYRARAYEPISFAQLRAVADFDLVRLMIETRKDQMHKLRFSVQPRIPHGAQTRPKSDHRCAEAEEFFRKPDKMTYWGVWLRQLLEDMFVTDAMTIYLRPGRDGKIWGLEVIDGATIMRLIDDTGRTPLPPDPAYRQIIKGVPAVDYTSEEIIYAPRNPRPHKLYGMSPVEQIVFYVNLAIRRATSQMQYYTEGNIPEAIIGVPETWTVDQIKEFQAYWDTLLEGNTATRRHAKFVPGGMALQFTRAETNLTDQFDEWLARIAAYAFSLPPMPFVRMVNRATAETHYEMSLEEGLAPLLHHIKDILDDIIVRVWGWRDLEIVWDDVRKLQPLEQANLDNLHMATGVKSLDDVRANQGADPMGVPPMIKGIGPMGFVFVTDLVRAIQNGLDTMAPPQPAGIDPMMQDIPPELMDAANAGEDADIVPGDDDEDAAIQALPAVEAEADETLRRHGGAAMSKGMAVRAPINRGLFKRRPDETYGPYYP